MSVESERVNGVAQAALADLAEIAAYLANPPQWHKKGHSPRGQTVTLLAGDLAADARVRRSAAQAAGRLQKRWASVAVLTAAQERSE